MIYAPNELTQEEMAALCDDCHWLFHEDGSIEREQRCQECTDEWLADLDD
jgi:predicted Zn-ribbon and HTH transcriptional regulator